MDKNYTTDAINLRSYDLSDADKIVLMYSKEKGLIRSVAKGVKRPKSKLGARMDVLVANTLHCSHGRNLDTICQAQTINSFRKIRDDILKLMCASYTSEIVANYGIENDPSSEITYDLLYSALDKISEAHSKVEILLAEIRFQLKIMRILGICPDFERCSCCAEPLTDKNVYFAKESLGIFCPKCNQNNHVHLKLHSKIRDFLSAMLETDFNDLTEYDQKANEKVAIVCFNLLKEYLILHSDKKFKSAKILSEVI